jgi:hypothetical protein
MVVEKFKEEEAERNALEPVASHTSGQENVSVSA